MADENTDRDVWEDAVSHERVDPRTSSHQSFYAGRHFHFVSVTNKRIFDEDPQLWVSTPHASDQSASLSPIGEPEN
jgi:YHS domain-containing protein